MRIETKIHIYRLLPAYNSHCLLHRNLIRSSIHSEIQIKNQPVNHVVFGKISGDDFKPADTILVHPVKTARQEKLKKPNSNSLPNYSPGMYRLVFGQTTYAK